MNKHLFPVVFIFIGLLYGCGNRISNIFTRSRAPESIIVNEVDFDYLSAKAKIELEGDKSLSGTANLRMQKDSVIWMSLSPGLGVEVARVMITRDSMTFIDKINKEYVIMSFEEMSRKLDFNVNYGLVESVILGNLIFPYEKEKVTKSANLYAYNQQAGNFYFENFIGARTMKLEKLMVKDTVSDHLITVSYSDFQLVEKEIFPYKITALLQYKDQSKSSASVSIEFSKTTLEKKPLKFPLNIPQKYERK